MEYISLEFIREFVQYENLEQLFDSKEKLSHDIKIKFEEQKVFWCSDKVVNENNLLQFINFIQQKSAIVFDQWIMASNALKKILFEQKIFPNDVSKNLEQHFLFREFQNYLSPFLINKLIPLLDSNEFQVVSFCFLLNEDSQRILQQKISNNIQLQWAKFEENINEEQFKSLAKIQFSNAKMQTLNQFTKAFYAEKITFIEKSIALFKNEHANYAFVFWLTKQLNQLKLNPEHQNLIQEILNSLQSNDGTYFAARPQIKTSSPIKVIVYSVLILAFGFAIWYFRDNFSDNNNQLADTNNSSFAHFSKKERIQLDSIIKTMERKNTSNSNAIDQQNNYLHLAPVDITLNSREKLKNLLAEKYIQYCIQSFDFYEQNKIDSCSIYTENQIKNLTSKSFKKLELNKGEKPIFIKNESQYQVQILIFDDQTNATVFSSYISPNQQIKASVKIGQKLIYIPGDNLGQAIFSEKTNESVGYQHQFCFMDDNFIHNAMISYTFQTIPETEIKLLFNENEEQGFYLVDLYRSLK